MGERNDVGYTCNSWSERADGYIIPSAVDARFEEL